MEDLLGYLFCTMNDRTKLHPTVKCNLKGFSLADYSILESEWHFMVNLELRCIISPL